MDVGLDRIAGSILSRGLLLRECTISLLYVLVVLHETDLVSAAGRSYSLAVTGGPYFSFAVGFAGFVLSSSLLATAVVVNLGLSGILLGVVVKVVSELVADRDTDGIELVHRGHCLRDLIQ